MSQEKVLIVEDEVNERTGLAELISAWGYRTETASDGVEGYEKIASWSPSMVVTDLKMPRMGGLELLERLSSSSQTVAVIVVTAQGTIDSAVQAMRMGAYDYVTKPIDISRLKTILQNASSLLGAKVELEITRRKLRDAGSLGTLIGSSKKMQEIFRLIEMVAPSTASVLITGASGTGKELVARTTHELSPRRNKPFVAINCAAIPETLIESEIFGHEKGAFTGAVERRTGCFELAEGGTLLLDEIGEMPIATQAKLLRVLEDRKLRRLGSKVETTVDVRVLAATNKIPEEAVARGELRNDLYYRLNVFNIHMPPLREHKEDIPDLVQSLLSDMSSKHGRKVATVSEAVLNLFRNYSWPGNVRELRNTLERAVIVCDGAVVETKHLPPGFGQTTVRTSSDDSDGIRLSVGTTVGEAEKLLILKTLESTNNNKTRAAEILAISLKTLHNKLKEYGSAAAAEAADKENEVDKEMEGEEVPAKEEI
ncbi:MAG: two component, sigma54 specific, transcriptional regulator, Fis family [Acidobacteriaceae bacterium]|nr:two component, sigma54 specific, transcriptional regulator, Fis family [Acidobacteriaceae bacterium]